MIARQLAALPALLALEMAIATLGCHRRAPAPPAPERAAGAAVAARRPASVRREAPFSHPLLAGASLAVTHESCSWPALSAVVDRALAIEAKALPPPADRARPRTGGRRGEGCPPSGAADTGTMVKGELLTRVAACVGQDGPFDAQWDMVHAAVLSLGVCLDCRRARVEQATQCGRARDVLERAVKMPR